MRTLLTLAFLVAIGFAAPAYADSAPGIASDEGAIAKDNAALNKDQTTIEKDRAQKAQDKATGNWIGQAVDSVALGADHVMHTEKAGEKSTDKVILNQDSK